MAIVTVQSMAGATMLEPLAIEQGVAELKRHLRALPQCAEGDLSLLLAGEVLTAASPLSGGSWEDPLLITALVTEQTYQVVAWGQHTLSASWRRVSPQLTSGVLSVTSGMGNAFAARKSGGQVVCWGSESDSEDESPLLNCEMPELQEGVEAVYGNRSAFVAIKQGGQALAWGAPRQGGEIPESIAHHLQSGVKSISQTNEAFCALKENGDVYAWGQPNFGGEIPSGLHEKLKDVISVSGTFNLHGGAFAALTSAGAVMTWGLDAVGGDSSAVAEQLQSGVCSVICGGCAFAALKEGGTVVTWGDPYRGGKKEVTWADDESEDEEEECSDDGEGSESEEKHDPYSVEDQLSSGVKSIIGSDDVFAALKETGEVVTWGMAVDGAHQSDELKEQLKSGVESISATYTNFSALKNGGLVIWGVIDDYGTGRSLESLQEQLESGVLGVTALPKPNLWGQFVHKASGEVIPVGFVGHLPDVVEEELKSGVEEVTGNSSGYVVLKRTS